MKQNKRDFGTATSLRETYVILISWIVFCGWTITCTAATGFWNDNASNVETVLGMPSWVAWGIALPWLVATGFTTWFCLAYVSDDEIENDTEGDSDV